MCLRNTLTAVIGEAFFCYSLSEVSCKLEIYPSNSVLKSILVGNLFHVESIYNKRKKKIFFFCFFRNFIRWTLNFLTNETSDLHKVSKTNVTAILSLSILLCSVEGLSNILCPTYFLFSLISHRPYIYCKEVLH